MAYKNWCILTKEYYSAFKKKEILQCGTAWMILEDSKVGEIS